MFEPSTIECLCFIVTTIWVLCVICHLHLSYDIFNVKTCLEIEKLVARFTVKTYPKTIMLVRSRHKINQNNQNELLDFQYYFAMYFGHHFI